MRTSGSVNINLKNSNITINPHVKTIVLKDRMLHNEINKVKFECSDYESSRQDDSIQVPQNSRGNQDVNKKINGKKDSSSVEIIAIKDTLSLGESQFIVQKSNKSFEESKSRSVEHKDLFPTKIDDEISRIVSINSNDFERKLSPVLSEKLISNDSGSLPDNNFIKSSSSKYEDLKEGSSNFYNQPKIEHDTLGNLNQADDDTSRVGEDLGNMRVQMSAPKFDKNLKSEKSKSNLKNLLIRPVTSPFGAVLNGFGEREKGIAGAYQHFNRLLSEENFFDSMNTESYNNEKAVYEKSSYKFGKSGQINEPQDPEIENIYQEFDNHYITKLSKVQKKHYDRILMKKAVNNSNLHLIKSKYKDNYDIKSFMRKAMDRNTLHNKNNSLELVHKMNHIEAEFQKFYNVGSKFNQESYYENDFLNVQATSKKFGNSKHSYRRRYNKTMTTEECEKIQGNLTTTSSKFRLKIGQSRPNTTQVYNLNKEFSTVSLSKQNDSSNFKRNTLMDDIEKKIYSSPPKKNKRQEKKLVIDNGFQYKTEFGYYGAFNKYQAKINSSYLHRRSNSGKLDGSAAVKVQKAKLYYGNQRANSCYKLFG